MPYDVPSGVYCTNIPASEQIDRDLSLYIWNSLGYIYEIPWAHSAHFDLVGAVLWAWSVYISAKIDQSI